MMMVDIEGSAPVEKLEIKASTDVEPGIQDEFFSSLSDVLRVKAWAILDIEYIQTTRSHKCIRKLYMLEKGAFSSLEHEFYPCRQYQDLEWKYQKSFRFCRAHIHKLSYNPEKRSSPCSTASEKIRNFITEKEIDIVFYKGGTIEKNLCEELLIPSMNIEDFGVTKAACHDPRFEVHHYYDQLLRFL